VRNNKNKKDSFPKGKERTARIAYSVVLDTGCMVELGKEVGSPFSLAYELGAYSKKTAISSGFVSKSSSLSNIWREMDEVKVEN